MNNKKLILGTVQLGKVYGINNSTGKPSRVHAFEILETALASGISHFDTADNYGSTRLLGEFCEQYPNANILMKGSLGEGGLHEAVCQSLQGIAQSRAYSFSLHNIKDMKHLKFADVELLKKKGLVEYIGVSAYTDEEIVQAAKLDSVDIIQIPFNVLDNWNLREKSICFAKGMKKTIHARSVFLQGLFFKDLDSLSGVLSPLLPYLRKIHLLKNANALSMEELALSYVLSNDYIDNVLIGVETKEQLIKNIKYAERKLNASILTEINNIHVREKHLLNPSNWS